MYEMSELKRDVTLLVICGLAVLGAVVLAIIFLPSTYQWAVDLFEPGIGLKMGFVIGFFVAMVVFIVFAIFAGDGLLGEIQFMIGGFLIFFFVFSFMIAWVF